MIILVGRKRLKTTVVDGRSYDPWANLALEEYLLQLVQDDHIILYLWQNQHTVVIGRNQNAWKECNTAKLEAAGGRLARRLSGGGAVYHDLGNLNFTYLMASQYYDLGRQLSVILDAVKSHGIAAAFSGRNDVEAGGRKFSGNAFYHGKSASFHHGTLLVNVEIGALQDYLTVSRDKIAAKGVDSVRSRVVNLAEINSRLTVDSLRESLINSFLAEYGHERIDLALDGMSSDQQYQDLYNKYSSWDWRYGKTPQFDISFVTRFPWGGIELAMNVGQGRVKEAVFYSDAMNADLIADMAEVLYGVELDSSKLSIALGSLIREDNIVMDVVKWLKTLAL